MSVIQLNGTQRLQCDKCGGIAHPEDVPAKASMLLVGFVGNHLGGLLFCGECQATVLQCVQGEARGFKPRP